MESTNEQMLPETLSDCLRKHFKSVHFLASSGRVHSPEAMQIGQQRFSAALPVVQGDCADHPFERFAGSDEQRLSHLNSLATLKEPRLLLGIRGGYGVTRLLKGIDFQSVAEGICESGSLLCAHSDFTALQTALLAHSLRLGQETPRMLQGPMLCVDFGNDALDNFMLKAFENALQGFPENLSWYKPEDCVCKDVEEEGLLWGGNLTMLASLLGTVHFPNVKNGLLFIEDVNEHPYRIERILLQMLQSGVLQQQKALIVGACSDWKVSPLDNGYDLGSALKYIAQEAKLPVVQGLPFGHILRKASLPIGKLGQLTVKNNEVTLKIMN